MEAGHGKGAPDGIGASIKGQADSLINEQKCDIMKAAYLKEGLKCIGIPERIIETVGLPD